MNDVAPAERYPRIPTIHVISDSVGATAVGVARAAASQFGATSPKIEVLAKVQNFEKIQRYLEEQAVVHLNRYGSKQMIVFYTIISSEIRTQLAAYIEDHPYVVAVDLMTEAISAISKVTAMAPSSKPGLLRAANESYFRRIDAVEFTIAHDDGRNPQDLTKADIVLIGVSRTSKTPLSIYLSQQGYKVSNIPLDANTEPPHQVFDVDRTRLFGLMTSPDVLIGIRQRRIAGATHVATRYADPEYVYEDLEKSRSLMRKLGCIVIHTENRAIEETAQEILRYYERSHPPVTDNIN